MSTDRAVRCPLDEFTGDSRRYWRALHDRDPRLRVEAQRAAQRGTPSWRPHARSAVTDSGTGDGASR